MVNRRDPRSPYTQVAAALRSEIESGTLAPGDQLPTTREIQERFKVGNPTVQRAIKQLKSEGLVEGVAGRGVFVRERRPWILVPASYLPVPADGQPDRWQAEAAKQNLLGTQELVKVEEVDPPFEVRDALNLHDDDQAILRQRIMLINGEPVELVDSYYPSSIARTTRLAEARKIPGGARRLLEDEGFPSRESLEIITSRMPTPDEAFALDLAEGVPVIRTLRTITSDGERPIEVSVMVMAGDRYRLVYRLPVHPLDN